MTCNDAISLIDPYMDGELDAADVDRVAGHVETCAECRRRLDEREGLRRLLRGLPHYDAPPRVRAAVRQVSTSLYRRRRVQTWLAAAAVVVAAAGGAAGLRLQQTSNATSAIADAVIARHVEALTGPQLIEVPSSDQHTVKPWFQGKIDFSPPVPDLTSHGFTLAGGRVDRINGQSVAALVYKRRLHVIHVFVWPSRDGVRATDARTLRGFHEQHWTIRDLSVWAVSDVNEDDLKTFASLFVAGS
jgi:anti-sigma factor (TIGR02949 family)